MKIKRFVTLMIVAVAGMAMMFAADQAGSNTTDTDGRTAANVTASATVGLNLQGVDLNSYTFGFSDNGSNLNPITKINLTMGDDYKAHLDTPAALYVYWEARTTENFKLSIATPEPLTYDVSNKINYTITFASSSNGTTTLDTSSKDATWEKTVTANPKEIVKDAIQIKSIDTALIPADQASGNYTSNLIVKITNA